MSFAKSKKVMVTGIAGRLARLVAKRLHRNFQVVGIDRRPLLGVPKDLEVHQVDLRRRRAEEIFRKENIYAVVHMGIQHNPRGRGERHQVNLRGTANVLAWCAKYGVSKVVYLSSANVYGPLPTNSSFLTEEAPLMGSQSFPGIRDLVAVDRTVQSFFWKHPEVTTSILRPVHIVGSHLRNAPSKYLRLSYPPILAGFDPMVQVIHEEDVVSAIVAALHCEVGGIFNVAGPAEVPLRRLLKKLNRKVVPVPHFLAVPVLSRLFDMRLTSFPSPEFDHIKYPCIVDSTRAKVALNYVPRFSMDEIVHAMRFPTV